MFFQISNRLFVNRENTVFTAGFNSHVSYGETVIHRHSSNAFSDKFHRLIKGAVNADLADDMQDQIFAGHTGFKLAGKINFDGGRHFKPCFTRCHTNCHIGRTDAC